MEFNSDGIKAWSVFWVEFKCLSPVVTSSNMGTVNVDREVVINLDFPLTMAESGFTTRMFRDNPSEFVVSHFSDVSVIRCGATISVAVVTIMIVVLVPVFVVVFAVIMAAVVLVAVIIPVFFVTVITGMIMISSVGFVSMGH